MIFWIGVFILSLALLLKSTDWLLRSAERLGLALGLSPFIIGVTIVGIGTSLPELVSSLFAIFKEVPEVVVANAVGSNIANIFLVIGLAALVGKKLAVTKDLIDLDLPLLALSTVLFLGVALDGTITLAESVFLLVAYGVYLAYTIIHKDDDEKESLAHRKSPFKILDLVFLLLGAIGVGFGAKYLIDSVISLSEITGIATGVISILAIAIGTSLPELLVSAKAALAKKSEIALGNILGSNVFNILVVVGIPGLFSQLPLDTATLAIGLPWLGAATLLFVISGISKRIHVWEGSFYLLLYMLFSAKILGLL